MPLILPPNPTFLLQLNLTALAGGGQAGATQCTPGSNVFTTVASVNDSCIMPPANGSGVLTVVSNLGAAQLAIYPPVGGKFRNGGINAPIFIPANSNAFCIDIGAGQWMA
jgi:hypothetical protein